MNYISIIFLKSQANIGDLKVYLNIKQKPEPFFVI